MFGIFQSLLGAKGTTITPEDAANKVRAGAWVIDVREPEEYAQGSIAGAVNIPLKTILVDGVEALERLGVPCGRGDVLLICRSGMRSSNACERLREALGPRALNLDGGLMAWLQAGLPITSKR